MTRPILLTLIASVLALPSLVHAEPGQEVVAFVGRLISIEEVPAKCPEAEEAGESSALQQICSMDSLFEAKYEVLDVFSGSISTRELSFKIADHYGFPSFADFQNALLFVNVGPNNNWMEKYQGYPVHRTTSDRWASCGNPYDERAGDLPRNLQPLSFATDLGVVGEFSEHGIAERFFDTSYLSVSSGRIKCHTGVLASDLYELVRTGVMDARGIQMPELGAAGHDL